MRTSVPPLVATSVHTTRPDGSFGPFTLQYYRQLFTGPYFAGAQFGNTLGVQPVLVAKRQVVQQVVEGLNAFCGQHLGELWTDSFNVLNGGTRLQHLKEC